ncbi:MAG: hypothetical protein COS97_00045 [Candidatus Nealsonbacteria bacterium CG07_land_8_20_14_0_80_40_10]|nr:MAG: hypothetical protein COU44_00785 [Candidatus Nealsonbacteria bacterium CG10_big_fil_rev_8_21_14_0_10_40_24]PIU43623.1 MAG: hypothetical protein COS97_00045 [Candidatus Nealsonbacteria bacterium CG07_land_8_20_14_0_80_40_10]
MSIEKEHGEEPIEVKFEQIKNLVLNQLREQGTEIKDEEWDDFAEEYRDQTMAGFSEEELKEMSEEEIKEAIYNCVYLQYIVEQTGEDPIGLFE